MDKETEDFEAILKELAPKAPSHGARWNLDRRLADLETMPQGKAKQHGPRLLILAGLAASILVAAIVWIIAATTQPQSSPDVLAKPDTPNNDPRLANSQAVEPDLKSPVGPQLIGDEKGVPSVITMEKHVTGMQDMGVVQHPDRPPMRQVRQEFINEFEIRDPDTGKTYRIHKPGSETIYIKMDDY